MADISLNVSQSVPLGLILNEAITNAIKYAYQKNEKGTIQVSLKYSDTDKLQLMTHSWISGTSEGHGHNIQMNIYLVDSSATKWKNILEVVDVVFIWAENIAG